ncbi:hypothetical protein D3C77_342180 [compost metagenome]
MNDGLRPDHFVAQGDAAGHGIQQQRQVGGAFARLRRGACRLAGAAAPGQPIGPGGGQQVEHRGGTGTAANPQHRYQHEGGQQGTDDGPCGVGGIQLAAGAADIAGITGHGTHQHRQGTAHQQRGHTDQGKGQRPGQQTDAVLKPGERAGGPAQAPGRGNTTGRHCYFQQGVKAHGPQQPVGMPSQPQAAEGESCEKSADAGGDGIDLDADHQ